jgi:hypothetical protein
VLVEPDVGAAVAARPLVDPAREQRHERVDRVLRGVVGERERDAAHGGVTLSLVNKG